MRTVTFGSLVFSLVLGVTAGVGADPGPVQQPLSDEWKRVRGAAFEVVGNASVSELRRVADSLEQYRQAIRLIFPGVRTEGSSPTRVVVFRDYFAMNPFKPRVGGRRQETVVGYFMSRPDINYMVLAPLKGTFTYQVLFHEFTHHIVRLNAPNAPLWLNEGLAEVYSTFAGSDRDSRALIGRPPPRHGDTLDNETLIPLSVLLSPEAGREIFRSRTRTSVFYAQSWAFVHYLLLGDEGRHQQGLRTFLELENAGLPLESRFVRAFGMSFKEMEAALRRYVHQRQLPAFQVHRPETTLLGAPEPIPEADALQIQGDLLVRLGQPREAETFLRKAATVDPSHADTQLSLARCLMQEERLDDAAAIVEPVAAAASTSFAAQKLHGDLLRLRGQYVEAVAAYGRALKLKPGDVSSFYGASIAQLAIGQPQATETFAAVMTVDPDPGWYVARMYEAWELGRTDAATADGRAYLKQRGWISDLSVYVALAVALEHLRRAEFNEAADILSDAAEQAAGKSWPAHLVGYLQGRFTDAQLLARADSNELLTEAHAYIGIKAIVDGRTEAALPHLRWVKDNGNRAFVEYQMAVGELKRLAARVGEKSGTQPSSGDAGAGVREVRLN